MKFRFTKVHVNSLVIAFFLAVLQGLILWLIHQGPANGSTLHDLLVGNDYDALAVVFAPTLGLVLVMKTFAQTPDDDE